MQGARGLIIGHAGWLQLHMETATEFLASLIDWHAYAREKFSRVLYIEADGHDPFHGSPLMRKRQSYMSKMDLMDADTLASQDLGFVWA